MPDDVVTTGGAAPAAGAPGSAAAAAPAAPAAPTGTEAALDAARQRLASEGTILPPAEGAAEQGGEGETDEQKAAREAEEAAASAAPTGETPEQKAAREAEAAAAAAPPADETPEQKAEREAAEAAQAEADDKLTVTLEPIEGRGEEPIEIVAPDDETFNRLNRLQNEAALGRQVKQERRTIERQYDQLEAVEDQIAIDATGFVLERVAEEVRPDVAMHLLLDPGVLEAVQERLTKAGVEGGLAALLEDPDALRVHRAEMKANRLELREKLRGQAETRKAMRANAQRVAAQVEALIPETITGEKRDQLYQQALQDVSATCKRLGIQNLENEDVALLVGNRFRQHGITAAPADGKGAKEKPASGKSPVPAAPARTGKEFTQASAARRQAAAAAPPGAGAPPAKPRPTLEPTTEGRIAQARKFGLRALLGKT